jgi:hypothetical protein
MGERFSAGLRLASIDDFISPSQACVKPVAVDKSHVAPPTCAADSSQSQPPTLRGGEGGLMEVDEDGTSRPLEAAKINLQVRVLDLGFRGLGLSRVQRLHHLRRVCPRLAAGPP